MTVSVRIFSVRDRLRTSLWFIPALCVGGAVALAAAAVAVDTRIPRHPLTPFLFGGGPESARNLLSTISAAMVTSLSLIFSVTVVVLQLASAQYSPRVLRSFIRDRLVQSVLGVYISTFVYSLLVLPAVQSGDNGEPPFVPELAVSLSLVLSLVSLALFVRYIDHIAHGIRAVTVINSVAKEGREELATMYPEQMGEDAPDPGTMEGLDAPTLVIPAEAPGVCLAVDEGRLLELARSADIVVRIVPLVGEFVPEGAPLLEAWGEGCRLDADELHECLALGQERTMHQDPAFAFRQLVDIAERALSPAVNDPTTAVQAIDQLHDLLRRLAPRRIPSPVRLDEEGAVRVIAPRFGWNDYVDLAFDEIRLYTGRSLRVTRRLRGVLEDLLSVAPVGRRAPLERQLRLLEASGEREFADAQDRAAARQGIRIS